MGFEGYHGIDVLYHVAAGALEVVVIGVGAVVAKTSDRALFKAIRLVQAVPVQLTSSLQFDGIIRRSNYSTLASLKK